jgi:cell wall-associated NlpC family hydrolase
MACHRASSSAVAGKAVRFKGRGPILISLPRLACGPDDGEIALERTLPTFPFVIFSPALFLRMAALVFLLSLERSEADPGTHSSNGDAALTGEAGARTDTPTTNTPSPTGPVPEKAVTSPSPAPPADDRVASLSVSDLREYEAQPAAVKRLLASALALTTLDLSYKYGSSDPANGGMDCSGTVYHLLNEAGLKDVPRDASDMYKWVWTQGRLQAVVSSNPDTFELSRLKPGDLLFWTGTYRVDRDPPVTHVMIYLGINRHTGRRVMVGASEGRRFDDVSRYGVSVFDFTLPRPKSTANAKESSRGASDLESRFVGYGSIPGLEAAGVAE